MDAAQAEALIASPEPVPSSSADWRTVRGKVEGGTWATLGILDFPEQPTQTKNIALGILDADGVATVDSGHFDGVDLWCPAVHGGWVSVLQFGQACRDRAFSGPTAVWARNRLAIDVEIDLRFELAPGARPAGSDPTPAYYASRVWRDTFFAGVQTLKCPLDLWVVGEIIHEIRPTLIVETGTFKGGSALYYARCLDDLGAWSRGRVVTIDTEEHPGRLGHGRLTYIRGSSTDAGVLVEVKELRPAWWEVGSASPAHNSGAVLVLLDSDHSYSHVLAELRAYAPLVTEGSYLIVEDTNTPGPAYAVAEFLRSPEGAGFAADRSREKFGITFNRGGWLKKGAAKS